MTPRAKRALELSLTEAVQRGDNHIGTGHVLLGLIREGRGVAIQVLMKLGCDPAAVRSRVTTTSLERPQEAAPAQRSRPGPG